MKKRGHIILAGILSFLFIYLTIYLGLNLFEINWKNIAIISLIVAFYSILPDVDQKNSTITWLFFGIGIFGLLIGIAELVFKVANPNPNPLIVILISTALLVFTFISGNFLKHRGIIHTVQIGLLACLPLYFIFHSFIYSAIAYVAWHSHLLGDGYFLKLK